jgi:hypothetical protein
MDYTPGARHIAKWQWDLMHDPGIVVRVFERDKDAAMARCTAPTPDTKGTYEGQQQTTKGVRFPDPMISMTVECSVLWFYHMGSEAKKAGWYTPGDYYNILYIQLLLYDYAIVNGDISIVPIIERGREQEFFENALSRLQSAVADSTRPMSDNLFSDIIQHNHSEYSKFVSARNLANSGSGRIDPVYPEFDILLMGRLGLFRDILNLGKLGLSKSLTFISSVCKNTRYSTITQLYRLGHKCRIVGSEIILYTELEIEIARIGSDGILKPTRYLTDIPENHTLAISSGEQLRYILPGKESTVGYVELWKNSITNEYTWIIFDESALAAFIGKSLSQKSTTIANIWKTKYPMQEMMEGRTFFEYIMREYRYTNAAGWRHTADIAHNFKGVDFYKGVTQGERIYAETAVSMKTTIMTDVNKWLKSEPIQKNLRFLEEGLSVDGLSSNGKIMKITEKAEVHIYMPKENITPQLKEEWLNTLNKPNSKIKFEIHTLEKYIK